MPTPAEVKALLAELGNAVGEDRSPGELRTLQTLLSAARTVTTQRLPEPSDVPPHVLRSALRQSGPLALADYIHRLRWEGLPDPVILGQLGWTNARRLRHYLALTALPAEIRERVERFHLKERQLRPLLKWAESPHFAALVEMAGKARLSSREIKAWVRPLGAQPSLEQALAALPARRGRGVGRLS